MQSAGTVPFTLPTDWSMIIAQRFMSDVQGSLASSSSSLTEGEEVGYVDYTAPALPTIPLGNRDGGTVGYGPFGGYVFKSSVPGVPTVFDAPGPGRGNEQPGDYGYAWDPEPTEVYEIPNAGAEYPYEEIPGVDPLEPEAGEVEVAIDWGSVISGSIDLLQGQPVGNLPSFMPTGPAMGTGDPNYNGNAPTNVTVNTKTGKVTPCRRRRRRRLLTEGDFNDLMRIATLPSKQNVAVALSKAVGRR